MTAGASASLGFAAVWKISSSSKKVNLLYDLCVYTFHIFTWSFSFLSHRTWEMSRKKGEETSICTECTYKRLFHFYNPNIVRSAYPNFKDLPSMYFIKDVPLIVVQTRNVYVV